MDAGFPRIASFEARADGRATTRQRDFDEVQELKSLANSMDDLARRCISLWVEKAPDPAGGVFGHLDRRLQPVFDAEGSPLGPSGEHRGDKGLIQISRHLYSYSLVTRTRGRPESVAALSHSCAQLLLTSFQTSPDGPLLHQVDRSHLPRDARVQLYAQSFAIFGLSAYARAFDDRMAADRARRLFRLLDALHHDSRFGGYDQSDDGDWLSYVGAPVGANKCTNTHIHILEALTELSHVAPGDNLVVQRLEELTGILATKMTQAGGYVAKFFDERWNPVGPSEVSYGHDIETSWLLRAAAQRLGELGRGQPWSSANDAANRMASHALAAGWDQAGGLFDGGFPLSSERHNRPNDSHVNNREKVWWAQAEALPGIYSLHRATEKAELVVKLRQAFDFLSAKSFDVVHGEFFWGVESDGSLGPRGDHKGELWKTPYHGVRALILTSDWIWEDLHTAPPRSWVHD